MRNGKNYRVINFEAKNGSKVQISIGRDGGSVTVRFNDDYDSWIQLLNYNGRVLVCPMVTTSSKIQAKIGAKYVSLQS